MNPQRLLFFANSGMVLTLMLFGLAAYAAWFLDHSLPLRIVAIMHLLQIVFAGLFKITYVLRLIAQKELGMELR